LTAYLKYYTVPLLCVFIAFLCFPFINNRLGLLSDIPSFENRKLAEEPEADINSLDKFPLPYENYYNDHFSLRNRLITCYNLYTITFYRKSPLPDKVTIGKDNWLFSVSEEMDSYTGRNRFTEAELRAFKEELEYRQNYLRARNCSLYFMVVPCKASIYGEKIGYEHMRFNDQSWGEQLNEYLKRNCSVKTIDVFDSLRVAKKRFPVYYKLDNHWNEFGSFFTANAVIGEMRKDFPVLRPLQIDSFKKAYAPRESGDIDKMLGNLDRFKDSAVTLTPVNGFRASESFKVGYPVVHGFAYAWEFEWIKVIDGSDHPSILIISDSFGASIFPFLAEQFRRTTKIFDAWQYKLNENIVEGEKPDIVLIMINEPILRQLIHDRARR
jgi:alginate O-acetyltransferase complex protein AlgJ